MFKDPEGRSLLFHGVNAVYKVPPYIPSDGAFSPTKSLNAEDIANLVLWGQNFVRLGVMWEAVERVEGEYDDDYLDQIETLINNLGKAGIYVLIDAHQDVFARVNCGEGIPDFYAKQVIGDDPHCIGKFGDWLMGPIFDSMGICQSIKDYGYTLDENGNPLIEEC